MLNRPNIEDLESHYDGLGCLCIKVEGHFPKNIPKNTYILSKYPYVSYRIMNEFKALRKLNKNIAVCPTSGHWEGDAFLLRAEEDIFITEEDENFIENFSLLSKGN